MSEFYTFFAIFTSLVVGGCYLKKNKKASAPMWAGFVIAGALWPLSWACLVGMWVRS